MANKVEKTFIERVLEFINGGEEASVKNIQRTAIKRWKKQIETKELKIAELKRALEYEVNEQQEYLEDAKLALVESYLNIDAEVKGKDNVDSYVSNDYESQIANAKYNVEKHTKRIESLQTSANAAVEKLEKEIASYKSDIEAIS